MEKVLAGKFDCDILENIFWRADNLSITAGLPEKNSAKQGRLVSYVVRFNINGTDIVLNDDFSSDKVYEIALKLAKAIDENSAIKVKLLKQEYGASVEFSKAKEFLNRCAKQVWDVFNKNYDKTAVPVEALKALGITNRPSLEFLLEDSLKYYEKDGGSTTADIIGSVIKNKNLDYTFEDICHYLQTNRKKYKYNMKTVSFLAQKLDYNQKELLKLGVDKNDLRTYLKHLPLLRKFQIFIKSYIKM